MMGKALERKELYVRAEYCYRKAIELDPDYPYPYRYLAELMDEVSRQGSQALELYRQYLDAGGEDPKGDVARRIKELEGR